MPNDILQVGPLQRGWLTAGDGDIAAAVLASFALTALPSKLGILLVLNIWGKADLLNAFYQGNVSGRLPGQLGDAFFIPTTIVPLQLIMHLLMFRVLLQHEPVMARDVHNAASFSESRSTLSKRTIGYDESISATPQRQASRVHPVEFAPSQDAQVIPKRLRIHDCSVDIQAMLGGLG